MAANDDEEALRVLRPSPAAANGTAVDPSSRPRFEIVAPTYTTPNAGGPKPLLCLHALPTVTLTPTARAVIRAALTLPLIMEEAVLAGGGVASMALVPPAMPATAMPGTAPWTKDTSALLADLARVQAAMSQIQPQGNAMAGETGQVQQPAPAPVLAQQQQQPSLMYQPLTPATATAAAAPAVMPAAAAFPGLPELYAGMLASPTLAVHPTSVQQQLAPTAAPQIVSPQVALPTAAAAAAAAAAAHVAQFQVQQQVQLQQVQHAMAQVAPAPSLLSAAAAVPPQQTAVAFPGSPDPAVAPRIGAMPAVAAKRPAPPSSVDVDMADAKRPRSHSQSHPTMPAPAPAPASTPEIAQYCLKQMPNAPHLRNHLSDYLRALGVTITRYRWDKRPDDANAMMPYAIVEMVGSQDLERRLVIGLQTHSFDGTVVVPFRLSAGARVDLTKDFTDVLDRAANAATELLTDPAHAPPTIVAPAIVAVPAAPITVPAAVPAATAASSTVSAGTTVVETAPRARDADARTSTTSRRPIHDDEPGALPPHRSRSRSRSRSPRHTRSRSPTYRARRRSMTPDRDDHYRHSRRVARFKVTNLPNDKRTSPIFLNFFAQAGHALYMHWTMGSGGAPASAVVEMTRHSLIVKRMLDLDGCVLFDRPISIDVVDPDDKRGVAMPRKPPAVFLVTGIPATGNRYNQMRHYMHSFGHLYQLDWRFRSRDKICYAFVSMQDDGSPLALKADGCEFYGGVLKVERITDPATFFADPTHLEAKLEAAYSLSATTRQLPYQYYQYQNSYVPSASARAPPPPLLPSSASALTLAFPAAAPTSADARLGGMMFGSAVAAKIVTSPTAVATAHGDGGAGNGHGDNGSNGETGAEEPMDVVVTAPAAIAPATAAAMPAPPALPPAPALAPPPALPSTPLPPRPARTPSAAASPAVGAAAPPPPLAAVASPAAPATRPPSVIASPAIAAPAVRAPSVAASPQPAPAPAPTAIAAGPPAAAPPKPAVETIARHPFVTVRVVPAGTPQEDVAAALAAFGTPARVIMDAEHMCAMAEFAKIPEAQAAISAGLVGGGVLVQGRAVSVHPATTNELKRFLGLMGLGKRQQ
ncbi:hypothetical protein GGF31_004752 [Allomyces arbusculus]|nr:hypothetical protein GGF31_004752 [Allomyces arbusculus]